MFMKRIAKIVETKINKKVKMYWKGKRISFAEIMFCNLAKARIEPEKVNPPIIKPKVLSKNFCEEDRVSERAIQTAARPPSPLKTAIICGNTVIFTFIDE